MTGYQEHQPSGFQEPCFRVFRNQGPSKHRQSTHKSGVCHDRNTRAILTN